MYVAVKKIVTNIASKFRNLSGIRDLVKNYFSLLCSFFVETELSVEKTNDQKPAL